MVDTFRTFNNSPYSGKTLLLVKFVLRKGEERGGGAGGRGDTSLGKVGANAAYGY